MTRGIVFMSVYVLSMFWSIFIPLIILGQDSLLQSFADMESDQNDLAEIITDLKEHPLDINIANIIALLFYCIINETRISQYVLYFLPNEGLKFIHTPVLIMVAIYR